MRFSLGFILALSLAGLQFLAIITVVSTSYLSTEKAMLQHARSLLAEAGENASEHSNSFLMPARDAAVFASRVLESSIFPQGDFVILEKFLFQILQNEKQLSGLYYGDETGNFVYVMRSVEHGAFRTKTVRNSDSNRSTHLVWRNADFSIAHEELDVADTFDARTRPWFEIAKATGATAWTDPYVFFSSQMPGITVATPVFSEQEFKGVVGVDIEISTISNFLAQLEISDNGAALILNENGDVLAHPNIEQIIIKNESLLSFVSINTIDDPVAQGAFSNLTSNGLVKIDRETRSDFEFENTRYVSLLKPFVGIDLPWTIAIYAPENDFTQSIKDNRKRNIWFAAVISFVTALAGVVLAEVILRPVRAFAVRTALVSQGEMSASEPLPRTYQELKKANETMIDQIAQRRDADAKILELNHELSHFSRLNLMGQMATGLAHELSQPLTAISQNVDAAITTAKQQNGVSDDLLDILSELDEQAHRGGDILRTLRSLVKKDQPKMAPFDFHALLKQTDRLLHHEVEVHDINLIFDVPHLPMVLGNRVQIAQVLINLIRNSIDAIASTATKSRDIVVSAQLTAKTLEVRVEDAGPGIDPNVTLFKQFETSKAKGMGLGLSICRTIMEANGGRLWHDPEIKTRTCFCLTLKVHDETG